MDSTLNKLGAEKYKPEAGGRKLKRAEVQPEMILEMLKMGDPCQCIESEVPQGAVCVGTAFNTQNNTIVVFISHYSFPEVPRGGEIPLISPSVWKRLGKEP
jgi:hypothetical protein